jgi:hypothetical protein
MANFIFPTGAELDVIAQTKVPRLIAQRPIFDIMPIVTKDNYLVRWEQKDNYTGLQQIRGLNGDPPRVKRIGGKVYTVNPGVYGEFERIDEIELTTRRPWGSWNGTVSISDLVMEAQDHLLGRRLDRIELIGWTLLATGTYSVAGPMGTTIATDTFTPQTFSASVTWATSATATPLADFRAIQLLGRGLSTNFGAGAKAYMNRATANALLNNTNSADFYGRRTAGLGTFNSLPQMNSLLAGDDLPQIVVYDEGYLDDTATFQLYIPNNKVIVVGQRTTGESVAQYQMVRNANNPGMAPGAYMKVFDRGENYVPRTIEVHDGHNGGPAIMFPSSVVVMTV